MSVPKLLMSPATCAPTSTAISGSMVPLALMVTATSPRWTIAVRKDIFESLRACHHHAPTPPARARAAIGRIAFFNKPCFIRCHLLSECRDCFTFFVKEKANSPTLTGSTNAGVCPFVHIMLCKQAMSVCDIGSMDRSPKKDLFSKPARSDTHVSDWRPLQTKCVWRQSVHHDHGALNPMRARNHFSQTGAGTD